MYLRGPRHGPRTPPFLRLGSPSWARRVSDRPAILGYCFPTITEENVAGSM